MIRISWSGLKRWELCRQKHLRVMQGRSKDEADARIYLPGTVADLVMRRWLEGIPEPGQMVEMVDTIFDQVVSDPEESRIKWRGHPGKDRELVREQVRATVTKLEPILLKLVVPYRYQPEMSFETTIGVPWTDNQLLGVQLIGRIDIVVQDDADQFHLYDLKATEDEQYYRKILGQPVFYDIAFGNWIGDQSQPKTFGLIFPKLKEQLVLVSIKEDDRRFMLSRVVKMAHGVWREEYAPKPDNEGCDRCEVQHVCDKFSLDLVKDEQGRHRASFAKATARLSTYKG